MLDANAREEMRLWLATMSKRQDLRDNPAAIAIEMEIIEEALFNAGARSEGRIKAIFHHLKTKDGLTFWPNAPQIAGAARALAAGSSEKGASHLGDRKKLSFQDLEKLEDEIIPRARQWLSVPALRGHGIQTLEYWGEKIDETRQIEGRGK